MAVRIIINAALAAAWALLCNSQGIQAFDGVGRFAVVAIPCVLIPLASFAIVPFLFGSEG